MSVSWSTRAARSRSSMPPCPVQSPWALKAPATPSGSTPSCTASGTPCSWAMPRRFAPWATPAAPRLPPLPGAGPLTALATVVGLGPVTRFADAKHVVSYVGLAPSLHASADKYRLGHITKQGSSLLRWVLGQAAPHAARFDADLKRTYFTLRQRRGRAKARVAVTRKLLVRLFIMLRDHIDYAEFRRRGRPPAPVSAG